MQANLTRKWRVSPERLKGKRLKCIQCGKECYLPKYRIETFKYCSRKCGHRYHSENHRVSIECAICQKKFSVIDVRSKTAKYCSRDCRYRGMIGRGTVKYSCRHCGKQFLGAPSQNRVYCSKACNKKGRVTEWSPSFTSLRIAMESRGLIDRCERCGYSKVREVLGIHHRDHNRNNNVLANLEVLCPNCHSEEHVKHTVHAGSAFSKTKRRARKGQAKKKINREDALQWRLAI